MEPSQWGPAGWLFLHAITFAQPPKPGKQQQQKLKNLFESLGYVLPCVKCCRHFREFVAQHPPPVDDREQLCRWLVDAHNNANAEKREQYPVKLTPYAYEDAAKKYAYDRDVLTAEADKERHSIRWRLYIVVSVILLVIVLACGGLIWFSCTGGRTCPAHNLSGVFSV